MPICIECSYPVSHLYSTYSRADDRSLGKGVRLTQCPRCKRFADKYVEHDFVVLFIDLVLIKPQVYRHLLFNRLGRADNQFEPSIIRLGILLLLFDVYLTWARVEKSASHAASLVSRAPIVVQYFFFLTVNALSTLAHHMTVRSLAGYLTLKTAFVPYIDGDHAQANAPKHSDVGAPADDTGRFGEVQDASLSCAPAAHDFSSTPPDGAGPTRTLISGALSESASPTQSRTPTQENFFPRSSILADNTDERTIVSTSSGSDLHFSSHEATTTVETPSSPPSYAAVSASAAGLPPPPPPPSSSPPPLPPHPYPPISRSAGPSRRPSAAPAPPIYHLPPPFPASPTTISTALFVSSCAKLFPILLVIWSPDEGAATDGGEGALELQTSIPSPSTTLQVASARRPAMTTMSLVQKAIAAAVRNGDPARSGSGRSAFQSQHLTQSYPPDRGGVGLSSIMSGLSHIVVSLLSLNAADTHLVLLNNIEALYILLGCGYLRAVALAVAGQVARWVVQKLILSAVGVG